MSDQENGKQGGLLRILLPVLGIVVLGAIVWFAMGWMKSSAEVAAEKAIREICTADNTQPILTKNVTTKHIETANLSLVKPESIDKVIPHVAKLGYLKSLNFSSRPVSDDNVAKLTSLPLTSLYLNDTEVTNEGVKHIEALKKLQALQIARTKVNDECLKSIATLKEMKVLDISGNDITGDLAPLKELELLDWLLINDGTVSDAAIETIASIESLSRFTLRRAKVNEELLNKKINIQVDYAPPGTPDDDRTVYGDLGDDGGSGDDGGADETPTE